MKENIEQINPDTDIRYKVNKFIYTSGDAGPLQKLIFNLEMRTYVSISLIILLKPYINKIIHLNKKKMSTVSLFISLAIYAYACNDLFKHLCRYTQ